MLYIQLRYLVPADLTVGQFVYVVRKRIKLSPEKAIFIFVKNILPPTGKVIVNFTSMITKMLANLLTNCVLNHVFTAAMMSAIYEDNKDEDGFLYMIYSGENTFGVDDDIIQTLKWYDSVTSEMLSTSVTLYILLSHFYSGFKGYIVKF